MNHRRRRLLFTKFGYLRNSIRAIQLSSDELVVSISSCLQCSKSDARYLIFISNSYRDFRLRLKCRVCDVLKMLTSGVKNNAGKLIEAAWV